MQGGIERENNLSVSENANKWLYKPNPRDNSRVKIVCFHHAGGSSMLYHNWAKYLPEDIELIAIQLPGRADRIGEQCYTDINDLLNDLIPIVLPELDRPFAFFGHSMGGVIASALTRELSQRGETMPQHLFISASPYNNPKVDRPIYTLPNTDLEALFPDITLENFGGDQEYFNIVLEALKADLQTAASFKRLPAPPLNDLPITLFYASDDQVVPLESLEGWEKETTGEFQAIQREGAHHYIGEDAAYLTEFIKNSLLSSKHINS